MNISRKQTEKIKNSGSFINMLMSNNSTIPEVGKGATRLLYSDRLPLQVIEVSEDYKTVKLEEYSATAYGENNQMGHQNWEYIPTGNYITIVWRYNAWRIKYETIEFEDNIRISDLTTDEKLLVYDKDGIIPINVVKGITKKRIEYGKINIIFGRMEYYYDWTI